MSFPIPPYRTRTFTPLQGVNAVGDIEAQATLDGAIFIDQKKEGLMLDPNHRMALVRKTNTTPISTIVFRQFSYNNKEWFWANGGTTSLSGASEGYSVEVRADPNAGLATALAHGNGSPHSFQRMWIQGTQTSSDATYDVKFEGSDNRADQFQTNEFVNLDTDTPLVASTEHTTAAVYTLNGTPIKAIVVYIGATAASAATKVPVYIETSLDSGTTWLRQSPDTDILSTIGFVAGATAQCFDIHADNIPTTNNFRLVIDVPASVEIDRLAVEVMSYR